MSARRKIDDMNLKALLITYSPLLIGALALFVKLPIEYASIRLFLVWLSLELSSLIALVRKEIPRLYPYASVKGRLAQIISGLVFTFWSIFGIAWLLTTILKL
jgi:hypothetical protein